MRYSYNWGVVLLLLLLIGGTTLSHNTMLGLQATFGVLLTLLLITALVTALAKIVLPTGPLKHGLLKLRGGRYR
jgi:hypothetical protein